MQELEKILEEIDLKITGSMGKRREGLLEADKIIRKHMHDGWIPVEERLPEESAYYLVTIEDYGMPYSWIKWLASSDDYNIEKSEWRELDDGEKVIAWQPLPEPYRPETK